MGSEGCVTCDVPLSSRDWGAQLPIALTSGQWLPQGMAMGEGIRGTPRAQGMLWAPQIAPSKAHHGLPVMGTSYGGWL